MTQQSVDPLVPRPAAVAFCLVVVALVSITLVVGPSGSTTTSGPPPSWAAELTPSVARARLTRLATTAPAYEIAYDRTRDFGTAWIDVDHNGCDTRNDILRRDLAAKTFRPDSGGCIVVSGSLIDPYTGAELSFSKSDAAAVQIDHLVPLHAAWILGAWRWSPRRRIEFANDPRNLVAVDGPSNQQKSDRLADRWRPENRRIRCTYAINTVAVHATYRLAVTRSERHALQRMLRSCP